MDTFSNDMDLRGWRQAYKASQSPGSPTCPSDDRLIALVLRELHGEARDSLADHIVRCQRCSATCQMLLRLHRAVLAECLDTLSADEGAP